MKYKYNIGDVVTLNKTYFDLGKIGIILNKPGHYYSARYTVLVCGDPIPIPLWEEEIEGIIE